MLDVTSQKEVDELKREAQENWNGNLKAAIAANIYGFAIVRDCGGLNGLIAPWMNQAAINDAAAYIEGLDAPKSAPASDASADQSTNQSGNDQVSNATDASGAQQQTAPANADGGNSVSDAAPVAKAPSNSQPADTTENPPSAAPDETKEPDPNAGNTAGQSQSDTGNQSAGADASQEAGAQQTGNDAAPNDSNPAGGQQSQQAGESGAGGNSDQAGEGGSSAGASNDTGTSTPAAKELTDADLLEILKNYDASKWHIQTDLARAIYGDAGAVIEDGENVAFADYVDQSLVSDQQRRFTRFVNSLLPLVDNYKGA